MVIDDWIKEGPNLRVACEAIRGRQITNRCWYDWQVIAGAVKTQHLKNRVYTDEQVRMLICIAWLRKTFPTVKLTYKTAREYAITNEHKIEEAFDRFVAGDVPPQPQGQTKLVPLSKVKLCCDRISNRELSRECWAKWKQHLGIPKYSTHVEEGMASLLTFLAVWRCNNPNAKKPSITRLTFLMKNGIYANAPIEAMSTNSQQRQWQLQGCTGRDLPKYLASQGYRVSLRSLYNWQPSFKKKKHYSVSELNEWLAIAYNKRYKKEKNHGNAH